MSTELKRFLDVQQSSYATALSEITAGGKRSHWMCYIFPQISGLGYSEMAKRYAIKNRQEAIAYFGKWRSGHNARHAGGRWQPGSSVRKREQRHR
jgi:uncharacterized protein (DUF1810 family)